MRESLLSGIRWIVAAAMALVALLALDAWFARRNRTRTIVRHALRLADDIAGVAETIEADLSRLDGYASVEPLRSRCREDRQRADEAFARRKSLDRMEADALEDLVDRLHDDHRRIVNLRSDVDSALSGSSTGSRIYKFARSRFPSSSFPTRPSTLM
jgi:hypothetical protein